LVLPICPGPENFDGDTHKPYAAISEKKNGHIKKGLNETEVSNYFGHCGKEVVEGSGAGGAFPGGDLVMISRNLTKYVTVDWKFERLLLLALEVVFARGAVLGIRHCQEFVFPFGGEVLEELVLLQQCRAVRASVEWRHARCKA
jgi:hypothetical protein